ncbi:hypothetical protein AUEXF2481DRAFT_36125 [Aureobasidium subglaciale EXF-2481]|uniref:Uncharacterized protein n=1 Tax=Aureobasidium subglaciale (strain EXF-2481) TaxID=1043005 RepID=A0A074YLW0_AURSE|nr:uncharacterized protein AUEXF2481DRAFT_36125 [Aureobasidium subglaciale EXF-2481]KEQ98808.1 hypothetical protein AUEXF2481DRAFT_36125 [Aureobasidium subglaciale EXF-2481]
MGSATTIVVWAYSSLDAAPLERARDPKQMEIVNKRNCLSHHWRSRRRRVSTPLDSEEGWTSDPLSNVSPRCWCERSESTS